MSELQIEIFSDVVCPWCYIGKRRLDRVLSTDVGEGVALRWRAYQLQPNVPVEGLDRGEYLARRYGAQADVSKVPSRIAVEAEEEGLALNYAAIRRVPNTFRAHRVLALAYDVGGSELQHALAERFFAAHFVEGADVGDDVELARLAEEVGLAAGAVAQVLAGDDYVADVKAELNKATDAGVSGVPCYLLGGTFPFPGAQTEDVMAQFITRAKERLA